MSEQQLQTVFADDIFVETLSNLENVEEVQSALSEKGIELTIDEILEIKSQLTKNNANFGELDEDDLEAVSGGLSPVLIPIIPIIGGNIAVKVATSISRNRW